MVRTESEIRSRLRHTRQEIDRANRLAKSDWLPEEDRAACRSLAEDLTRQVHLLSWVLGGKATCEPYQTGWERDCQSYGTHVDRPADGRSDAIIPDRLLQDLTE